MTNLLCFFILIAISIWSLLNRNEYMTQRFGPSPHSLYVNGIETKIEPNKEILVGEAINSQITWLYTDFKTNPKQKIGLYVKSIKGGQETLLTSNIFETTRTDFSLQDMFNNASMLRNYNTDARFYIKVLDPTIYVIELGRVIGNKNRAIERGACMRQKLSAGLSQQRANLLCSD